MQLLSSHFDFPMYGAAPTLRYAIACTQRTGSTLLSLALWGRGVCGAPLSYFNPYTMDGIREAYGLQTDKDYADLLFARRVSLNGVFGYKIAAPHWLSLQNAAPHLFSRVCAERFIYLQRRNHVAQAISLYKAEATGLYFPEPGEAAPEIPYDFAAIRERYVRILRQNDLWRAIFARHAIAPHVVFYEDLSADVEAEAEAAADFLGLGGQAAGLPCELPVLTRQSNKVSADWESRFRAEPWFQAREAASTAGAAVLVEA
jgi:LPS sulfotransferase NodH